MVDIKKTLNSKVRKLKSLDPAWKLFKKLECNHGEHTKRKKKEKKRCAQEEGGRKVWGKAIKWLNGKILFKPNRCLSKNENPAQLKPIEMEYELEQIKCQGMKVGKAESDYEQPVMKDIKIKP